MVTTVSLGFPRIGARRELKKALESYWAGEITAEALRETGRALRFAHWEMQREAGIDRVPCNDFSFYDQMLDTIAMTGCVPARYGFSGKAVDFDTYFAMARGSRTAPAMEMTKWFDTNYHYIVPEFEPDQAFRLASGKAVDEFLEAKAAGYSARPVLIGPVTFLKLGKAKGAAFDPITLLPRLLPVYSLVLQALADVGAREVQMDEPILALDLSASERAALIEAYRVLAQAAPELRICVASYFGALGDNLETAMALPVAGLHVDLVRAPEQLGAVLDLLPADKALSLGVIDGRNVWRADLSAVLAQVETAVSRLGAERVVIGPSCSLLHSPVDLAHETGIDPEIVRWMAFARQKCVEISTLAAGVRDGRGAIAAALADSDAAAGDRRSSVRIHNPAVRARLAALTPEMARRHSPFPARRAAQQAAFPLPAFPTTTIGSFPQTPEIREARAAFKKGTLDAAAYEAAMKADIAACVAFQEEIGIDVLVHGEAERNDMVEYFGEQLSGFVFTKNGWVQSYGSRCVKPPVIYGDVSRPAPMTVFWSSYAQSLTQRPMKGMLTGPVTILQWSFVRNDQPRETTCRQIALAIRDEVSDLERAGIRVIQIDEPAVREGLPLRRGDWAAYLGWAVESFRLASSSVADATQIHTHMCYSEFNNIIAAIADMDADVISIETSRSQMELLDAFAAFHYPNDIGPGVYDIHSPRVPETAEMVDLLERAARVIPPAQLWVNPDCGLKTRRWQETKPALARMVEAARVLRGR